MSHLSCVSNDFGYEYVFSRFVEAVGKEGDVLFGLSTSGNSKNILNAIEAAKAKGMKVIAMTGKDGGKMALRLCRSYSRNPHQSDSYFDDASWIWDGERGLIHDKCGLKFNDLKIPKSFLGFFYKNTCIINH